MSVEVISKEQVFVGAAANRFLMVCGGVTLLGAVGCLAGYVLSPERFAFAYLYAFAVGVSLVLGAMFFTLVQHLSAAGWSSSVRRLAEILSASAPVLALLFVPVALLSSHLYPWLGHHGDAHEQAAAVVQAHAEEDHGEHAEAHAHTPQEEALHAEILESKSGFLNLSGFLGRSVLYLLVWALLGVWLLKRSRSQDERLDIELTGKMQKRAAPATIAFGLSLTFAAFDWLMSLEPAWYSTIFGVYFFAGAAMAVHALLIVSSWALKRAGYLGNAVNVEHYHDLGKLMFAFMCFWTYVGFSQLMLIWYATIPEEITYYQKRWVGTPWGVVGVFLIIGHFAAPFVLMMSRVVKRKLSWLVAGAAWLLCMHLVDLYWFVVPYAGATFAPSWMDFAALLWVLGALGVAVALLVRRAPLIAIGDPRLSRAFSFVNA